MASSQGTVDFIVEQMAAAGTLAMLRCGQAYSVTHSATIARQAGAQE
ncbi:hypothetical protein [Burkholderia sp. Ac-20344]|nr:hypothetical protein [Burkholderia sp. Ac-20344]MBN3830767.1 hypothetical protein [Burkholderia sp. Ac-20344]